MEEREGEPARRVTLGKPHAFFCELVQVRRFDQGMTLNTQVTPTKVVGEKDDKIGRLLLGIQFKRKPHQQHGC
jgi:hypothetical protein